MAAFLLRATGGADNLPAYRGTFPDVPAGQWYTGYVEKLAELGISTGYTDGTFRPAGPVTRAEMAIFITRAIGEEGNLATSRGLFTDVPASAPYAAATERLYDLGITLGCATGPLRYCPADVVSRDQMASFLARAFGLAPVPPPPRPGPAQVRLDRQLVAGGLTQPLFLDAPRGDNRLFIVEQPGRVRIVAGGNLLATPFLDISDLVGTGGERGLLGLAFHPQYATNGRFYVNYTDTGGTSRVAEYVVSSNPDRAEKTTGRILLSVPQPASNHNGGMLAFGPDGYLYIGMGDGGGGGDPSGNGQRPSTLLGAVLRIDVTGGSTYAVPAGNPFVAGGGAAEVWAFGLRNPWRFSFDGQRLYIADVGQGQWEEIDVLTTADGGANLGLVDHGGQPLLQALIRLQPNRPGVAGLRIRSRGGMLGHRRVRLPGHGDPGTQRPLLLRRLLLGMGTQLSVHRRRRCRHLGLDRRPRDGFCADLVRYRRSGRAVRGERRRQRLPHRSTGLILPVTARRRRL